jgi:hypothetical protein
MKMYGGADVKLHYLTPGKSLRYSFDGRWVGLRTGLDAVSKGKIPDFSGNRTTVVQSVA